MRKYFYYIIIGILTVTGLVLFIRIFSADENISAAAGDTFDVAIGGTVMKPDVAAEMSARIPVITARPVFFSSRGRVAAPQEYSKQDPGIKVIGISMVKGERMAVIVGNSANTAQQQVKQIFRNGDTVMKFNNQPVVVKEIKETSVVFQLSDGILERKLVREEIRFTRGKIGN